MHGELNQLIPSFVKRAQMNDYLVSTSAAAKALAAHMMPTAAAAENEPVTLIDYDRSAEEKIIAAILYPHVRHPLQQLRQIAVRMSAEERRKILVEYFAKRRHRRDKPGRAFENVFYTFDILGNLGLYRDLHRHRILTQERQEFTTVHGYDTPPEIEEGGFKSDFDRCMNQVAGLYAQNLQRIAHWSPVCRSFCLQDSLVNVKMNLREAVHMIELRTMPQGHPDYRFICQEMWRKVP